MNINEAFPSNYLKAADLQGRTITVKISRVTSEKLGDDNKLILYFEGKQKGMVLNKTNANNLAFAFGPETDDWQGAEAQLYPTMVDFQGRSVEALRIKPVPMRRSTSPTSQPVNGTSKRFVHETSHGRITSGPPQIDQANEGYQDDQGEEIPF
jgi:hypothetical protein